MTSNPRIASGEVNLFSGLLAGSIPFQPGLNLVSGENGTCKTHLLRALTNQNNFKSAGGQPRILAFSPKRNSERKAIDKVIQEAQTRNLDLVQYLQQRSGVVFQDDRFDNYSSFAEVYFFAYETACGDGGNQIEKMNEVANDFNNVIKRIFPQYELVALWDKSKRTPTLRLRKGTIEIGTESLSLGEQEILSLVFNIYASRKSHDVILVDEPEIHLNWHLEERLFDFFDWFCQEYQRQMVVATHSRIVFADKFLPKTWFLYWEDDKVKFSRDIPANHRRKLTEEAVDFSKLFDIGKPVFSVEDARSKNVVETIAKALERLVAIINCNNSGNVENLFRLISAQGQKTENYYFMTDGDNRQNPFPGEKRFIHLDRYCIENYLLDIDAAAKVTNKQPDAIKKAILDSILENPGAFVKTGKGTKAVVELLKKLTTDSVTPEFLDALDSSKMFNSYLRILSTQETNYIESYVRQLLSDGRLDSVFPEQLINAVRG